MKKAGSYNGIVTEISSAVSKNGVPYTNLCLQVGQDLVPMVAFAEVSSGLMRVGVGQQMSIAGTVMDDGAIRINFFNAPNMTHQVGPVKIKREYAPETLKMEWLMDVLTPEYVTRRLRELFKWKPDDGLPDVKHFKDGSCQALLDSLEAEANLGLNRSKDENYRSDEKNKGPHSEV